MKRPKQGIRSMRRKAQTKGDSVNTTPTTMQQVQLDILPIFVEPPPYQGPAYGARHDVNLIPNDKSIAKICFVLGPLLRRTDILSYMQFVLHAGQFGVFF